MIIKSGCKVMFRQYLILKDKIVAFLFKSPNILDMNQTIKEIIDRRASVSRFGDGEFELIRKKSIPFQDNDFLLSRRLCEVLKSNNDNLLIGLPKAFEKKDLEKRIESTQKIWEYCLSRNRLNIYKHINRKNLYIDANFTRPYITFKNKNHCKSYFEDTKKIWENRDILFVEGEYSRLGVGNDLFNNSKSIKRILAPVKNAFSRYDKILNETIKYDKSNLILIALGPTATVLAYDLSKLGYQAIDIGHIDIEYEWFLKNAKEKIAIKNKYTNEVSDGKNIETMKLMKDIKYEKQIVSKII